MPRLLFVVISIFVNVPTHAQTSGATPPPARVVFTKIDTIPSLWSAGCKGQAQGMHAWPSSEAFELSLSEYSLKVTPNAGTSGYTVQTAGSSRCDKTYNQATLEHGYFSSICTSGLCHYNFSLSVGYVDAEPGELYCYGKCLLHRTAAAADFSLSPAFVSKTCGQCTDSDLESSSICTMEGVACNGCVVTNPTPQCETCLPFSSVSCPGTTGGWNNQDCQGSNSQYYCCCGGEGYYCRDEADCPSPAPVPSPEPTPPPTFPTPGSKIACHGAPTTPFPTPTPIPTPFSTPTPTPTPPMPATTCGPCEGYCFIENKDQCITCSSDGAGSHATSKICNQQHGIWCTTCECPPPSTPAPAPDNHADNGGGSSFPYLYVGVAAVGVIVVIMISVSVWLRSRKAQIDGVDSAPLVENDQMLVESGEPYHEFSGDETTC